MNPANFPNGGGMGGAMAPADKAKIDNNTQMLVKHVAQLIQTQGPFTGWRESVSIQWRVMKKKLLEKRTKRYAISDPQLIYEMKPGVNLLEKADYERECTEKLLHLRDKRQQAVMAHTNPQTGMPIGAPNQNQMQHMFPNGMPRPAHGGAVPAQQQQAMGVPNQQPLRQQGFLQNPEGRPGPIRDDMTTLSPKEFHQVCQLADQLAQKTSPADLEKIKMNLQNMTPEHRQSLDRKGLTPLQHFFRCQALKNMRKLRQSQMGMASPQTTHMDPANNAESDRMLGAHQRQMSQPVMPFQGSPAMPMAGPDPTFAGNVDHIQGQQMDPLRSQEPGHSIIPVSTPHAMNHPPFGGQQGVFQAAQPNPARPGVNAAMLAQQQHRQNLQNAQQEKLQHAAQFQAQSDAQARAQAAAKAQRAISSQANPQIPQTLPQQNQAVPMMNRPVGPVQVPQGGVGPTGRAYPRPAGMGQSTNAMQTPRSAIPSGLPLALQNQLAQLPPEQVNVVLQNYRRSVANNPAMLRQNQNVRVQPPIPDSRQVPQVPGSNLSNDPNTRVPMGMHHSLTNMGGMQPPQGLQNQQFPVQKPNQQPPSYPQPPDPRLQYLQQRRGSLTMTEEQIREMDRVPFPPAMLNSNPALAQALPKALKTWGQLKMWAGKNPQALGDVNMEKLVMLQRYHFGQMLHTRREVANRVMGQPGAASMEMDQSSLRQASFKPQGPQPLPQQFPSQPQLPPNMPMRRPINATNIQFVRQKLGAQVENLSDDALLHLLEKNRQKHFMEQAARNREAAQAFVVQSTNQVPASGHIPAPSPPPQHGPTTQAQPQVSQPIAAPGIPSAEAKTGPQNVAKATRGPVTKPSPKNLKRPNAPEVENKASANPQPQVATAQTTTGKSPQASPAQPTREQLASMNPQQRAQWEAHMRRQQSHPRQTIPKDAADDAWSRLPDHLKQMYAEIVRNDNATVPVAMTSDQKAAVSQQLRENTDMLSRMDALVQWVAKYPGQENPLRILLQMRMLLMKQFKGPDWNLAEHFTITPDYLASAIMYIKKWFAETISRVQNSRQNQSSRTAGAQSLNGQTAPQKVPTPLNASNLQQLEQQEAALQRARKAAQPAPPAPTTMQPPFPLGATSPQGVPRVYGPTNVTQESLTLPPPKRRKPNQSSKAATKPTQQSPSTIQEETPAAAETKKSAPIPKDTFRCPVAECQYHLKGFPSQAALDNHVNEQHKPEEPVSDALEFAIESYRKGLGLDKANKKASEAQDQKTKASAALGAGKLPPPKSDVNAESVHPVPQQMAHSTSIAGVKSISPSSLQAKPSQMSATKGSSTTNLKTGPGPDGKKNTTNNTEFGQPPTKDPWEDSPTSLETICSTFSELAEQSYFDIGWDPVDELLVSDAFTAVRSKDTPQSTDASAITQTPQDSDVSKDDDIDIVMGGMVDDSWIPSDWVRLPEEMEGSLYMNDQWEKIDWDAVEANDLETGRTPGDDLVYSV
ncbi:hypothetical protein PRK78_000691 [Emydomyces testavorans]|uniref:Mediator complex subunit 15 KIX domain-containing protein n=1 Tax=Emydomyces testavorans TaxID=2070801 RepID=A0AAF0DB58_9EURO|nr:hypothetical protein PRK78_000691 [Emydomyces testavorans]